MNLIYSSRRRRRRRKRDVNFGTVGRPAALFVVNEVVGTVYKIFIMVCLLIITIIRESSILTSAETALTVTVPTTITKNKYICTATVDRRTGLASSKEVSSLNNIVSPTATTATTVLMNVFEQYPIWLCKGCVSFGLLKAIPKKNQKYEIRTRVGNINLLTFDHPYRSRRRHDSTVILPIIGGMMSYNNHYKHNKRKQKGYLYFTIEKQLAQQQPMTSSANIVTGIEQYAPMLVHYGRRCRAGLYLSTQSVIHAYVMWRFHRYCVDQIQTNHDHDELKSLVCRW
jgi:hypothetical protein